MIHQISEMREQVCDGLPQISNGIAQNCDFPGTQDAQAGLQADRPAPFRTLQVTRLIPELLPLSRNYLDRWGVIRLRFPLLSQKKQKKQIFEIFSRKTAMEKRIRKIEISRRFFRKTADFRDEGADL